MKKIVKIVLFSVLGLAIAGFAIYSATAPMQVELTELKSTTARLSFVEQGVFAYQESFELFPRIAGEIREYPSNLYEGASIRADSLIAVIEITNLDFQMSQLESMITVLEARQAQARDIEQEQRDALAAARRALDGQVTSLQAQIANHESSGISLDTQIDHQHDVIAANRRLLSAAGRELRLAEEADNEARIVAAQTGHAQARQMLAASEIMLAQMTEPTLPVEFFTGQLDSVRAEITAIDTRLGRDYSASAVRALNTEIESLRAQIQQLRDHQGRDEIRSPVGGVITQLNTHNATVISLHQPLAVIEWNPMMEVFVSTRDLDSVAIGDTVSLTVERRMGDQIIGGRIAGIEGEAHARLSPLGVEERKVRLLVRPDDTNLVIGGSVDVSFSVFERENSIVAPKTAIFQMNGQEMAWIVRDGELALAAVQRGVELREGYLIESGLAPGDRIVRDANTQGLAEGKRVAG
jgi:predicted  nucleic acid-binding Zn-ribbon protein